MYITTSADSQPCLEQKTDEIRRVFKNRGAILDRGLLLQLEAWQSTLPVGVDKLAVVHRVMSPVVGTCWPFFTAACGTPDGVPFGFALASHEPVLLNPFFRGNGKDANNMFVVGTTGAGKSFAVSMLILRLLPLGTRFVLIDKTVDKHGAYRFITELIGREHCQYVDLVRVRNIFSIPLIWTQTMLRVSLRREDQHTSGLVGSDVAKEKHEELEVEEKSLLDNLIRLVYRAAQAGGRVPTISDLALVTAQAAAAESEPLQRRRLQRFARGLEIYTDKGAFAGLLDGQTNIDSEKLFIVFDTREINDPRLERIAVFITAEFIRRRAAEYKQRGIRFAAIIDEASTLMRFKAGARLLDDLSRRGRQYGMMLVSITQQLKDFFGQSEHADSVVKNSHMKLILRQDPSDLRLLKETLRLSDAEIRAVENFSRGEEQRQDSQMLLIAGAVHGTISLVPSPIDYWICTSDPIKDIPRRQAQIAEVLRLNPGISYTNAARHAVFQLGTQWHA